MITFWITRPARRSVGIVVRRAHVNLDDIDGGDSGAADVQVYVRTTDDDPNGSPLAWSSWQLLQVSEFNNRAFEFQARLTSDDPVYNVEVSAMTITKDEVA